MASDKQNEISKVLQKIGRNVMLFQLLEGQLKTLLFSRHISGYVSEIQTKKEVQLKKINSMPMGEVTSRLLKTPKSTPDEPPTVDLKEPWFSVTHSINGSDDFIKSRKKQLKELVAERNELIHHVLPKWSLDSAEDRNSAIQYLDLQSERIQAAINRLNGELDSMKAGLDLLRSSPEYKQALNLPDK